MPAKTLINFETGTNPDALRRRMELSDGVTIEFPSRWVLRRDVNYQAAVAEVDSLCRVIVRGCEAITGVYMRLCDLIRVSPLSEAETRELLARHFPQPRVSEIVRVSRAPDEVYARYQAGFFGFKAALRECRSYQINSDAELTQRKARRAAVRLVALASPPVVLRVREWVVKIELSRTQ